MTNEDPTQEDHHNPEQENGGNNSNGKEEKKPEEVTINVPSPKMEQLEVENSTSNLKPPGSPGSPGAPPQEVKKLLTGASLALVFIGMCLAVFLAALDQTIVATALPTIAAELHGFSDYSWVATAYLLTTTAFQPLYGRFSDIFGRKPVMLFAIVIFELGSLLCGVSQTMTMLIVSRAIAGIGGGGLISMVMIIMSDVINIRDRGKYQGIISAMFGLASVVGPLLGGAFTDHVTWRWCFFINLPFGAITVIVTIIFLNLPTPKVNMREKLAQIDYFGVFTLLPAIVALLLAVSWGGNEYAWNSGVVISMFVVAGVFAIAFVLAEGYLAKFPIIPLQLFKARNYTLMMSTAFLMGWCMLGSLIYLPLYFQIVKGDDATASGLRLLPLMISLVLCSIASGIFIAKTGKYRWIPTCASAVLTVGMGVLILLHEDSTFGQLVGLLIPSGVGMGWLIQTMLLVSQAAVEPKFMGVATAAVNFFRSIGGVVGVAVFGAVVNNTLNSDIRGNPAFDGMDFNFNNLDSTQINSASPEARAIILKSMADAIDKLFEIATPIAGVAIFLGLFIKFIPLRQFLHTGKPGEAPPPPPPMAD